MMRIARRCMLAVVLVVVLPAVLFAAEESPTQPAEPAAADGPSSTLPYTPSLDLSAMNRRVNPCIDFYGYACGGWMKNNPIPPDQARWSVYGKLQDENQRYLWGILEQSARPDSSRSENEQKIGDYFSACMDEAAVEKAGLAPIKDDLEAIEAIKSVKHVAAWLAKTHLRSQGSAMLFGFGAEQDPGDSDRVIAWALAGGLGLPDRDYYLKDDAKSAETRARYEAHVRRMFELLGDAPKAAAANAATVLAIETALARASLTRVERRDPYKIYNKMTFKQLQALTPAFRWKDYVAGLGMADPPAELNVTEPAFFKELQKQIKATGIKGLRTYLRWHLVHSKARYLSSAFVEEDFAFYRAHLRGVKEERPRWKRCVALVDRDLGEALGQVFVSRAFPPEVKAQALDMVVRIEKAMESRIEALPWMGSKTKKEALRKLASVRNKIGYPDRWRDYGSLEIARGEFLGNVERALAFESRRQLTKIGKPVDRDEWAMTPPTVNAYYNPSMNDINFPAGVLMPPLFDPRMDSAPNYGNTGGTIGHELIHAFDDEGRKFDADGNLKDWWTAEDAQEFERRASCIAEQYSQYTIVDDIKINSRLTLGEDVADLAGVILAWDAWMASLGGRAPEERIDGLTPQQRFFVGFAQWACENDRDENKRVSAVTNPHSPGVYRINGVVANMPEFAEAFGCQAGQSMAKKEPCRIW